MARSQHVHIAGEPVLLREYGSLCLSGKRTVSCRPHLHEPGQLPKGIRRAASPPPTTVMALELTNIAIDVKRKNLLLLDRALAPEVPIVSSSVTVTVAEQSSWIRTPRRLIGLGALPTLLEGSLVELVASPAADAKIVASVTGFFESLGKEVSLVKDSIGLVMPRVLCTLANEAYFAMMEGVAAGQDIDTAMKLGTNYPAGPVERAGRIGLGSVCAVLSALHRHFGEERYRLAPSLQQAACANP